MMRECQRFASMFTPGINVVTPGHVAIVGMCRPNLPSSKSYALDQ